MARDRLAGGRLRMAAGTPGPETLTREIEILAGDDPGGSSALESELRRAVHASLDAAGTADGHLALTLVSPAEIRRLNLLHRGRDEETDVISFPMDADPATPGPRELGDVAICTERTDDLTRAAVHGVLHLLGHDHERDAGEMLALEDRVVASLR
jgi:probable rRNA maturation factor